jgi:hypothetical protein
VEVTDIRRTMMASPMIRHTSRISAINARTKLVLAARAKGRVARSGKYPLSPYWKKIMDQQTKGDGKGKWAGKGQGNGTKGTQGRRTPPQ